MSCYDLMECPGLSEFQAEGARDLTIEMNSSCATLMIGEDDVVAEGLKGLAVLVKFCFDSDGGLMDD